MEFILKYQQKLHRQDQNNISTAVMITNNSQKKNQFHEEQRQHIEQKKQNGGIINFMIDFLHLYKYSDQNDKVLIFIGIVISLISGVTFPLYTYFWGKEIDHINFHYNNLSESLDTSLFYYVAMIIIGISALLIDGLSFSIWKLLSVKIAKKIRVKYLTAFCKKSINWIEKENLYQFSSQFKTNCLTIEKAIGDKVALFYNLNGIMLSGSIAALCVRWTFTLYLFALLPIILGILGGFLYVIVKKKMLEKQFYKKAQAQTIEATNLIKTVKMLGIEDYESAKFKQKLEEYANNLKNEPMKVGITTGLFYFIQYLMYGIGYMYAIQCVRGTSACPVSITGSHYTMGDFLTVFFELFLCSYNFLQLATNFESIKSGIECSKQIYKFVDQTQEQEKRIKQRISLQQNQDQNQKNINIGDIQLRNVRFCYPQNPQKSIFNNLSIRFLKNKFNAIAGSTGSGKSTIIQLILKHYAPTNGQIFINGVNLQEIDQKRLRNQIGYVGQEPTLFNGTIRDNIQVGKEDATDEQIYEVLKMANIYNFVMEKEEKLDFQIGFGGSKLSGGQKQRLAVARALIKRPSLLILDEATSALDRKSQMIIQESIHNILSNDRKITIICIAHRLKTISSADKIWYIEDGRVKKQGKIAEIQQLKFKAEDSQISQQLNPQQPKNNTNITQTQTTIILKESKQNKQNTQQINIYSRLYDFIEVKRWYFIAIVASILNGINHPAAAIILSYLYDEILRQVNVGFSLGWCQNVINPTQCEALLDDYHFKAVKLLFGMIGFAFYAFVPYFIQFTLMTRIQDQITTKIRSAVFDKLMVLPVQWHQSEQNEGGKAAFRCSIDAKQMGGLLTNYIPIIISNFCTIFGSIIISLCYNWKLGLLSLFTTPLIALSAYISMIFIGGYDDESLHKYQNSDQLANELIMSIRTVLSFNYQNTMIQKYEKKLIQATKNTLEIGAKIGFMFGSSVMIFTISVGSVLFAAANILAYQTNIQSIDFVILFTVPVWSGWIAGNNFFYASHVSAGKQSAKNIFNILDLKGESEIKKIQGQSSRAVPSKIKGKIQFRNVTFRYYKNSKTVLNNVSFVIEAGQKVALVGHSGCGKSTIMQLLQRFYQYEGQILLDDVNILEYDLKQYRALFGVVNQQPSLFMGTLKQNIINDKKDTQDKEIINSCKIACAYDLKQSYSQSQFERKIFDFLKKQVGPKGSKISGGQKQRVAMARALLRIPQIFLMDQGTSALDRQTEKKVQENLDSNLKGITTINVAHRIQTIQNSDSIFLFENGKVIEQGRYTQLMKKRSSFQRFVKGKQ